MGFWQNKGYLDLQIRRVRVIRGVGVEWEVRTEWEVGVEREVEAECELGEQKEGVER